MASPTIALAAPTASIDGRDVDKESGWRARCADLEQFKMWWERESNRINRVIPKHKVVSLQQILEETAAQLVDSV